MGKVNTYELSPLGTIGTELLKGITALKQKYPETPGVQSMEKKYASKQINALETIIKELHSNLLPNFDNCEKPGLLGAGSISKSLLTLMNLREKFITRKYALFRSINKELPALAKRAQSQIKDGTSPTALIIDELKKKKKAFFKNALQIPGGSLDALFEEIKNEIASTFDEKGVDHSTLENTLTKALFKRKSEQFGLVIADPMTFEFAELAIRIIENAPQELSELIPFFNPEAFQIDLHSNFLTRKLTQKLTGSSYAIKHDSTTAGKEEGYVYHVITYTNGIEKNKQINGSTKYKSSILYFKTLLMEQIKFYFSEYKNTPHVKSQIARSLLLSQFRIQESQAIETLIKAHLTKCNQVLEPQPSAPLQLITVLDKEIAENELFVKNNLLLQKTLTEKKKSYETASIAQLAQPHSALQELLQQYKAADIATDFSTALLPQFVIGSKNIHPQEIEVIQLQKPLNQLIEEQLKALKNNQKQLKNKILQQKTQREEAVKAWQTTTIKAHAEKIKKICSPLKTMKNSFKELTDSDKKTPSNDNNIDALKQTLVEKKSRHLQLEQLKNQLNIHSEQIRSSSALPEELTLLDANHVIQQAQKKQCDHAVEKICRLAKQIKSVLTVQEKELYSLKSQVEKAESEALFAKNMKEANPENINLLLTKLTSRIAESTTKENQLKTELSTEETRHKETEDLTQKIINFKENLDQINTTMLVLIRQIYEQVPKHLNIFLPEQNTLTPEPPPLTPEQNSLTPEQNLLTPEQNPLITDPEKFDKFIKNLTDNLLPSFPNIQKETFYENTLSLLVEINSLLKQQEKKFIIPFKEIDKLPTIQELSINADLKGFKFFLALIGLEKEINEWEIYRNRQDDFFKFKPKQEEYAKKISSLNDAKQKLQEVCDFKLKLTAYVAELKEYFKEKKELSTAPLTDELQKCSELQKAQVHKKQELEDVVHKKEQLQEEEHLLKSILSFIQHIETYQQKIETLATHEYASLTDASLYQDIAKLHSEHQQLIKEQNEIKSSSKASIYTNNIDTLTPLMSSTQQKLATTIKLKIDVNPIQEYINQYQEELAGISQDQALFNNKVDQTELGKLSALIKHYTAFTLLVEEQEKVVLQFATNAAALNEEHTNQSINHIQMSQDKLRQDTQKLGILLMHNLVFSLKQLKTDAKVFQDHEAQESTEVHQHISAKLNGISKSLDTLPDDEELDKINLFLQDKNTASVNSLKKDAIKQAEQSTLINQELLKRIEQRASVVDKVLLPKLTIQGKASSFIKKHNLLITNLQEELKRYKNSGNSTFLLDLIKNNTALCSNVYFRTILSKLTAELMELDDQIPQNYNAQSLPENYQIKEVLEHHQKSSDYVTAINTLYQCVDDMANKWPNTIPLTVKLRKDIDHFVISHPTTLPNEESYNKFERQFLARLHSEDMDMAQHRSAWKNNLANFAIGLFTLGVALGIKLIYSKFNGHNCRLFFAQTKREKQIEWIEDTLKNHLLPPRV